jgi:ribose/xylose/arabinose/galactoside ABC-type transport system permease subunit
MIPEGIARRVRNNPQFISLGAIFVIAVVAFSALSATFATPANLLNIAIQGSATAIVATAMTLVIITAGIDLSPGAVVFIGGVALGFARQLQVAPVAAFLLVIAVSLLIGSLHGLLIGGLGLNPMLITIGTFTIIRGVGERLSNMQPIPVTDSYQLFGNGSVLGIPAPILVATVFAVVAVVADKYTSAGRLLRAIGSNSVGARESGIRIRSITCMAYMFLGLTSGVASLVMIGRLSEVNPHVGDGFELTVITAVVLGGTSLMGGSGSIIGSLVGAFLLATVENGLVMVGASPYWYDIFRATVLILAVVSSALATSRPRWLVRILPARKKVASVNP